jgi:hypothetical protein
MDPATQPQEFHGRKVDELLKSAGP